MTDYDDSLTPNSDAARAADADVPDTPPTDSAPPNAAPAAGDAAPPDDPERAPHGEPLDIDAALAAVSLLSDVIAEREAQESAEREALEREAIDAALREQQRALRRAYVFPAPPMAPLQRGTASSVVPALLLMGIGGWLTFTLSTGGSVAPGVLAGVVLAGLALALLVRWSAQGRWARGLLFTALTLLFGGALLAALALFTGAAGYPLLLSAPGLALVGTALFGRPRERRLLLPGVLLILGSAVGLVVTGGVLPAALVAAFGAWWFVPAAVLVALLFLRRRHAL